MEVFGKGGWNKAALSQASRAALRLLVYNSEDVANGHHFVNMQVLHCQWIGNPRLLNLQVQLPNWHIHREGDSANGCQQGNEG